MAGEMCDAIRIVRERRGYTQDELAEISGISRISLARYEAGRVDPSSKALKRIATALDISVDALINGEVDERPDTSPDVIRVPVLGTIPAGIPVEAVEDIVDWEELPKSAARGGKEFFALRVHGDSMYPEYRDGDTIVLQKAETCESGDDCAVSINGDDAVFKRVRRNEYGIMLQPLNPAYEPATYSNAEIEELPIKILGVVRELRRKIK